MQMDPLLQAAPDQCCSLPPKYGSKGEQYQGFCIAGEPDGHGEWTNGGGDGYLGEWRTGQHHGHGTYTWANGAKYVCE
jgi:hypothetical protein